MKHQAPLGKNHTQSREKGANADCNFFPCVAQSNRIKIEMLL